MVFIASAKARSVAFNHGPWDIHYSFYDVDPARTRTDGQFSSRATVDEIVALRSL